MSHHRTKLPAIDPLSRYLLRDQVAVVTGAAGGIGQATAQLMSRAGATVVCVDRCIAGAQKTADEIGAGASACEIDVSEEASVEAGFAHIVREHRQIDVLVNNAGIAIRRPSTELSLDDWNKVVAVNMTGVFLCARAAARHMIADRGGAIVNTASILGLSGGGLYPNISYQTTKGAVVNMTRALAVEWARHRVRVNAVAPTYVKTQFIAALMERPELMTEIERMTPMGRLAEPEEIASAILFLASPAAAMVTGHILAVDGGYLAQ